MRSKVVEKCSADQWGEIFSYCDLSEILNGKENLEKLGNDGYLHVKNNFDWKHLSLKIFEIFEKTINEKSDR